MKHPSAAPGRDGEPTTAFHPIFEQVIAAWNTGRVDPLPDLLHPDYRGHMLHLEQGERDAAAYPAHILAYRQRNPGATFRVHDQFAAGDRVCTRLSARRADPATGEEQEAHGLNISRYAEGQLAEEWALWSPWRPVAG